MPARTRPTRERRNARSFTLEKTQEPRETAASIRGDQSLAATGAGTILGQVFQPTGRDQITLLHYDYFDDKHEAAAGRDKPETPRAPQASHRTPGECGEQDTSRVHGRSAGSRSRAILPRTRFAINSRRDTQAGRGYREVFGTSARDMACPVIPLRVHAAGTPPNRAPVPRLVPQVPGRW